MASPSRSSPSPFRDRTPESTKAGLRRKDSKHALTTCHGLTSNGKACRRPLAAKDVASSSRYTIKGTMVVPTKGGDPAVFFCWQHKDQAEGWNDGKEAEKVEIGERNSLETVFQKLGLEEVEEEDEIQEAEQPTPSKHRRDDSREKRKPVAPRKIQRTICGCFTITELEPAPRIHTQRRKSNERVGVPVGKKPAPYQRHSSSSNRRDSFSPGKLNIYQDQDRLKPPTGRNPVSQPDFRRPLVERKPLASRAKSEPNRQQLKEWTPDMPENATDAIRLGYAKLITAMTEPPSKSDDEGYIYMFWQSEMQQTLDETDAAASIVGGPTSSLVDSERILQRRFFRRKSASGPASEQKTIFLKIGRAGNVHQRMSQWQRQCGYNISLLRYYPMKEDITLPYVGKVERLIHLHLEMLGKRVKRECRCGTEHREWFEIEGTASAIKEVDSIIMQWVTWALDKYK